MMRIRSLEHSLDEAARWSRQTASGCASKSPLPACELHFVETVLRQTRKAISQCERRKLEEEQRASGLRGIYLEARRERKTVSTLRENALRQFQIEQSRREQSSLDELFLGKLHRSRNTPQPASAEVRNDGSQEQNHDRNLT